jgi:ABC-2 type transport system permease protein
MTEAVTSGRRRHRREPNPLLVRELRGRMRGARAFVVLTIYLLLLSCFVSIIYGAMVLNIEGSGGFVRDLDEVGKTLFIALLLIETLMVAFITPAFTAGAITGERERKTYELLRATLLPTRKLVAGKLTTALTYVGLLILAAVPLESLPFLLGGVTAAELILGFGLLAVTAFVTAVLGLFLSSVTKTTLSATVLTYAIVLLTTIVLPIVAIVLMELLSSVLWPGDLLDLVSYVTVNLSPVGATLLTVLALEEGSLWLFDIGLAWRVPTGWIIYTAVHLPLAVIMLVGTVVRLREQRV